MGLLDRIGHVPHPLAQRIREQFRSVNRYEPNLRRPRTFNEKIQWIKLNYHDPLMTTCSDKWSVREHVARTIGADVLVPALGVWDDPDDIDFDALPEQFVLKATHGSGANLIVRDRASFDSEDARSTMQRWLEADRAHYFEFHEWAYKDIRPRILGEEYIQDADDLPDYKLWCFDGEPRLVLVCTDRQTGLRKDFFTPDWNHLPFTRWGPNAEQPPPPPASLPRMLEIARTLAAPFPFARVDLYDRDGAVMFGEITFYPGAGIEPFEPVEWDRTIGDMLTLPRRRRAEHWYLPRPLA